MATLAIQHCGNMFVHAVLPLTSHVYCHTSCSFGVLHCCFAWSRQATQSLADGDTIADVMTALSADTSTEHPTPINTLERFNVWPELAVAVLHRSFLDTYAWWHPNSNDTTCYGTCECFDFQDHGTSLHTCTGRGHPIFFYLECVWHSAGLHAAALWLVCYELGGGSLLAALFGVTMAAMNHSDLCRYHWAPPLRESFGFPWFVLMLALVTGTVRRRAARWVDVVGIVMAVAWLTLSWQLAQFVLLTHVITLCATYLLGYLPWRLHMVLHGSICTGYVVYECVYSVCG